LELRADARASTGSGHDAAGADGGVGCPEQGSAQAGLQLRRSDDMLRLHAGDGTGQRPLRPLRVPRTLRGRTGRPEAARLNGLLVIPVLAHAIDRLETDVPSHVVVQWW